MSLNVPNLQALATGLPDEVQSALRAALAAQDKYNRDVANAVASLSTWTWVRPQLLNGWTDFSATLVARYAVLSNGLVAFAGAIHAGTLGLRAFTLPTVLCPSQDVNLEVASNAVRGVVTVGVSGAVTPAVGDASFMALDNCLFLPARA